MLRFIFSYRRFMRYYINSASHSEAPYCISGRPAMLQAACFASTTRRMEAEHESPRDRDTAEA